MQNTSDESSTPQQDLRRRAEAIVEQTPPTEAKLPEDQQRVLHELQVHQVELELQNEELRRSQAELQDARDTYAALYDFAPIGYLSLDPRGIILGANLTAAALLGVDRGALPQTSLARFLVRDDQDTFYLHRRQVFETGTPQTCDLHVQRPDGTVFVASLESRRVQAVAGQGQQCFTALSDITPRKLAEEALLYQRDWLDVTLSSIGDGVIATDTLGSITSINREAERLTGWSAPEAISRRLDEVFRVLHEHTRQPVESLVMRTLRDGTALDSANHMVLQTRENQEYIIISNSTPIHHHDGTLYGVVLIFRDMTENRRLETEVRQAQKMRAIGTLAGGIAHEFNNLLSAILGFAELIQYEEPQRSRAWENVQRILTAGHQAKEVVQQLLAFSRQADIARSAVYPQKLVQETLGLLRASLPATIALHQHCGDNIGAILANATQLQQVVMNLCVNAEQAMRETGGTIDVHLDTVEVDAALAAAYPGLHPEPHIRLVVRDTGPGMEPRITERIFEPFFTTKEVGEGAGMGLAIVHGIIASHGGAIAVESTPGHGTTFTVYLPRIDQESPPTPQSQEALPQGTERILFVDDEQTLALLGHEMLTCLGYQVEVFTNSQEALEAFHAAPQSFDLVITDQTMPQMTGAVLARELLRLRPDIPVILCTGFSHVLDAAQAQEIGIDAFLMKPVILRDLAVTIRQVLTQRRST